MYTYKGCQLGYHPESPPKCMIWLAFWGFGLKKPSRMAPGSQQVAFVVS